jgi:hypothetical protein
MRLAAALRPFFDFDLGELLRIDNAEARLERLILMAPIDRHADLDRVGELRLQRP